MITEEKIKQLKKEQENALYQCKTYKNCTDGSYESCLSYYGYYEVTKELKELERGPEDNGTKS